jgi:hypothetical protein
VNSASRFSRLPAGISKSAWSVRGFGLAICVAAVVFYPAGSHRNRHIVEGLITAVIGVLLPAIGRIGFWIVVFAELLWFAGGILLHARNLLSHAGVSDDWLSLGLDAVGVVVFVAIIFQK